MGILCSLLHIHNISSERECEHGQVRLVGGITDSTGILEFCAHGVWGRVCDDQGNWSPNNSLVVCSQLGFSNKGVYNGYYFEALIIAF